jgi:hypothetical protein
MADAIKDLPIKSVQVEALVSTLGTAPLQAHGTFSMLILGILGGVENRPTLFIDLPDDRDRISRWNGRKWRH